MLVATILAVSLVPLCWASAIWGNHENDITMMVERPENSSRQSPIDIDTSSAVWGRAPPLEFEYVEHPSESFLVENTGYGPKIYLNNWDWTPTMRGGPLDGEYRLKQVHFHWGNHDGVGSEHYINGKAASMEAHLVHYKTEYGSYEKAQYYEDGLAVIAFFIECPELMFPGAPVVLNYQPSSSVAAVAPTATAAAAVAASGAEPATPTYPNSAAAPSLPASCQLWFVPRSLCRLRVAVSNAVSAARTYWRSKWHTISKQDPQQWQVTISKGTGFQPLISVLPSIPKVGDEVEVNGDLLAWANRRLRPNGYYAYDGSLTSSPYSENVIWIVYEDPLPITFAQLSAFRIFGTKEHSITETNYREVQPLNGRTVHYVPKI